MTDYQVETIRDRAKDVESRTSPGCPCGQCVAARDLMVAINEVQRLRTVIGKWVCGLCQGTGVINYPRSGWYMDHSPSSCIVTCERCEGTKLEAVAREALA